MEMKETAWRKAVKFICCAVGKDTVLDFLILKWQIKGWQLPGKFVTQQSTSVATSQKSRKNFQAAMKSTSVGDPA